MKKFKYFTAIIAMFLTMMMLFASVTVYAAEPTNIITGEQAQKIALTHVQSALMLSEDETLDKWHWGMKISKPTAMYDLAGNISSYYFSLSDENGGAAGYIIIGSNPSYAPVVEYATSGYFYPAEALETEDATTIYYTGGMDYLIGNGETYMDVSSFGDVVEATEEVNGNVSMYP